MHARIHPSLHLCLTNTHRLTLDDTSSIIRFSQQLYTVALKPVTKRLSITPPPPLTQTEHALHCTHAHTTQPKSSFPVFVTAYCLLSPPLLLAAACVCCCCCCFSWLQLWGYHKHTTNKQHQRRTTPGYQQGKNNKRTSHTLTVRLLVAGAGTGATELLGLTATGVSNQEATVVALEEILNFLLRRLINVYCLWVREWVRFVAVCDVVQ